MYEKSILQPLKAKYNSYWKENSTLFNAGNFIAELTQHIPPSYKHLIRYYGVYCGTTEGEAVKEGSLAKFVYNATPRRKPSQESETETISNKASRLNWTRFIQKVYEVDE
jgi:hypothetical protein